MRIVVERVVIAGLAAAPDPGELRASLAGSLRELVASGAFAGHATIAAPDHDAAHGDAGRPGPADRASSALRVEVAAGADLGSALGAAIAGSVGRT